MGVSQRIAGADELADARNWCTTDAARLVVAPGMCAEIERRERSATLVSERAHDEEVLVHPFLAAPGAVFAWWEGREALHGGAFLAREGAFALIGDKDAGKSSTLARLAAMGMSVLSDDLLVVRGTTALAGPRCLDLRPDMASRLPAGVRTTPARESKRRLALSRDCPAEAPLRGVVFLTWGEWAEPRAVPPADRLPLLAAARTITGSRGSPGSLLELARLPGWELRRPRSASSLEPLAERLLGLAGAEPGGLEG